MSKMDIEWHEECAANAERSVSTRRTTLVRELDRLIADEADVRFYREQIAEAKRRGVTGFDRERMMVKRKA